MLTAHILHMAQDFLAAPSAPTPAPTGDAPGSAGINTEGIMSFFVKEILPIAVVILGVSFVFRARGGQVSRVLTSSGILLVGVVVIAGAGLFYAFGDNLVHVILH